MNIDIEVNKDQFKAWFKDKESIIDIKWYIEEKIGELFSSENMSFSKMAKIRNLTDYAFLRVERIIEVNFEEVKLILKNDSLYKSLEKFLNK